MYREQHGEYAYQCRFGVKVYLQDKSLCPIISKLWFLHCMTEPTQYREKSKKTKQNASTIKAKNQNKLTNK